MKLQMLAFDVLLENSGMQSYVPEILILPVLLE